jgi:tetratricopeptide (TPR) repeat protein
MDILVSGQAGAASVLGRDCELLRIGELPTPLRQHNLGRIFVDCNDVERHKAVDLREAEDLARRAWAADRALRLFLLLLDDSEPLEDGIECASCLEELLVAPSAEQFVQRNMYSAPLSPSVEPAQVRSLIAEQPRSLKLFEKLIEHQDEISRVRNSFDEIPLELFREPSSRVSFLEDAIDSNAFFDLACALRGGGDINFVVLRLLGELRHVEGARTLIAHWTSGMRTTRMPTPKVNTDADEYVDIFDERDRTGVGGFQAYENVKRQQSAIIDRLKRRDISGARWLVDDLLATQAQHSSADQIAKSLSKLSQQAKLLGVPELQLEWAERAVTANAADPRTFGQLADALIGAGRYNEASTALQSVEAAGEKVFAEIGRARILRATGRLVDARAKYLAIAEEFPEDRLSLAGAAEVLRDMGRHDEALSEYRKLTELAPLQSIFWAGMASTLMDLGRFQEAITYFNRAASHGRGTVPSNGRATVYKLAGKFDEALRIYDEVIRENPNDQVSLCGRAEVFRVQGDLAKALDGNELPMFPFQLAERLRF